MANVKYKASTRKVANGRAELMMRFYGSRKVDQRARTYIYVPVATWSDADQRINAPRRCSPQEAAEARQTQSRIEDLTTHVLTRFMEDEPVINSLDWLQGVVDEFVLIDKKKAEDEKTLQDVISEYVCAANIQEATAKQYRNVAHLLDRFQVENGPILANSFSVADIEAFVHFLRTDEIGTREGYGTTKEQADKEETTTRCQNTINTKLRRLRAAVKWWCNQEEGRADPFTKYKIESDVYGSPTWLKYEERDAIYKAAMPTPELAIQRDIFCFQCCIGCRVSDLTTFTRANITEDGFLEYVQHKLRKKKPKTIRVPLNAMALEIIERYAGLPGDRLLPYISDQKYNQAIKRVLRAAGITRNVMIQDKHTYESVPTPICDIASSHLARRTFCANLYKQTRSERIVSSMSGHAEGSRAFARYSEVDDDMKKDVIT